ncbi:hypothetical protein BT63DRAFT_453538 [Microthyrium microscopicum]|uniref:BTB domain-containing protein n=1 Tax=Microthyrium microscopicum TaxID=703497 RepID=A0A6A6UG34_9PEZI|nr:hypothetical protein BT63DRAFT_453538 [Microthyrium microscopicum]
MADQTQAGEDEAVKDVILDDEGDLRLVVGTKPEEKGQIVVSSAFLARYSPFFRSILKGSWKESVGIAKASTNREPFDLALPDDDFQSMVLMCEVLYHWAVVPEAQFYAWVRHENVLLAVREQAEKMLRLLISCEKYDVFNACKDFLDSWNASLAHLLEQVTLVKTGGPTWKLQDQLHLSYTMFVACACSMLTRSQGLFRRVTKSIMLHDHADSLTHGRELFRDQAPQAISSQLDTVMFHIKASNTDTRMRIQYIIGDFQRNLVPDRIPYSPAIDWHGKMGPEGLYQFGQHDLSCVVRFKDAIRPVGFQTVYGSKGYIPVGVDLGMLRRLPWNNILISNDKEGPCWACSKDWKNEWLERLRSVENNIEGVCLKCVLEHTENCGLHN